MPSNLGIFWFVGNTDHPAIYWGGAGYSEVSSNVDHHTH